MDGAEIHGERMSWCFDDCVSFSPVVTFYGMMSLRLLRTVRVSYSCRLEVSHGESNTLLSILPLVGRTDSSAAKISVMI